MYKSNSSMQLLCSLCPKRPLFSDISHLLTHISSKSHLSHRFKLQIRSQSEPEAKDQLDNFDFWYHANSLDVLLSERLNAKEQKKVAKDKRTRPSNIGTRKDKDLAETTPLPATSVFRAPVPRMHLWPTSTNNLMSGASDDWKQSAVYATPTNRREIPNFSQRESPGGVMFQPNVDASWNLNDRGDENFGDDEEKLSDITKLKGLYWPGMNLFDSATPDMKRMRNQRKDGTVLEQMMAGSEEVEPTEWSYNPDGEFRSVRNIFGPLSTETSPTKFDAPTPKKRKTRKSILADVSVNIPRLKASRTRHAVMVENLKKNTTTARQTLSRVGYLSRGGIPILNPLAAVGGTCAPSIDEVEEFRLTFENMEKKRPFSIFQDAPEESPGRTESPLEGNQFDFMSHGLPLYPNNMSSNSHMSPTPVAKRTTMHMFGKENRKPQTPVQPGQATAASTAFPPQGFLDPVFNPLYNQSLGTSIAYGSHQPSYSEDVKSFSGFSSSFHGDFKPAVPMGPGANGDTSVLRTATSGFMHYTM